MKIPNSLLCVLLCGCSSVQRHNDLAVYAALSAADATTTYIGVERGLQEANPVMRLAGNNKLEIVASSMVISAVVGLILDRFSRSQRGYDHSYFRNVNILRGLVVAWNVEQICKGE